MKSDEKTDWAWMVVPVLLCLAVIGGCPPVRRPRVTQEVRGWQVETVSNFRVTITNDTMFIEIGGEK